MALSDLPGLSQQPSAAPNGLWIRKKLSANVIKVLSEPSMSPWKMVSGWRGDSFWWTSLLESSRPQPRLDRPQGGNSLWAHLPFKD